MSSPQGLLNRIQKLAWGELGEVVGAVLRFEHFHGDLPKTFTGNFFVGGVQWDSHVYNFLIGEDESGSFGMGGPTRKQLTDAGIEAPPHGDWILPCTVSWSTDAIPFEPGTTAFPPGVTIAIGNYSQGGPGQFPNPVTGFLNVRTGEVS